MKDFVHLHLHTDYSLMDGCQRTEVLFQRLKENGMNKVAITNHGNIINMPKIIMDGEKKGIQVIPGCELYVCWDYPATIKDSDHKKIFHMVVLAKNMIGYKNLIKLTSRGYLEGMYYKPRVDRSMIEQHSEGLICLTACLNGTLASAIGKEGVCPADLSKDLEWFKEVFGENLYLEIQRHPETPVKEDAKEESLFIRQERANEGILELSRIHNVPVVATCDAHYSYPEHFEGWQSMMLLQTNFSFGHDAQNDYYVKTKEEMNLLFADMPEVIERSATIANGCEPIKFDCSIKYPPIDTGNLSPGEYLKNECYKGLEERIAKGQIKGNKRDEYVKRLEYECKILDEKNFSSYLLLVADYTTWAKNQGILMAPGRGSGAGSLACYLTRITEVDPIPYGLIFERFINPERNSFPDIDQDFQDDRRDEVKEYFKKKNGEDKVCSIMTIGTLAAKNSIKEIARRHSMPFLDSNMYAKTIPDLIRGRSVSLKEAYEQEPKFRDMVNSSDLHRKIYDTALIIEGMAKSTGVHAAGVISSNGIPLDDYIGQMVDKNGNRVSTDDMKVLEKLGFIKLDFLGLNTLTIIAKSIASIKKNYGVDIDVYEIPLDDKDVFSMIREGKLCGVFQLGGSSGFRDITMMMQPQSISNISDINAVYRPGPLDNKFPQKYSENLKKANEGREIEYMMKVDNPRIQIEVEKILKPTYGVCLYQEQIQFLAQIVAGYTLGGADNLRRAIGKKIQSEMQEQRSVFVAGCLKNNISEKSANELFDQIDKFADYCFNKSHSVAYSIISYWTAWLKYHYPNEFMAANLTEIRDDQDKTIEFINACRDEGIEILPPDINKSNKEYTPSKEGIRFGLSAIKGLGDTAITPLLEEREEKGRYTSFENFIKRSNLTKIKKSDISCLIKSGCFNSLYQKKTA